MPDPSVIAVFVSVASIAVSAFTVHYARMVGRERKRLQTILDQRAAARV